MRIAMIGQKGAPALYGGIERHVDDLSVELAKKGHEVLVYARSWYSPKIIKKYHGTRIIHTPTIHTKHLDAIIHTFISTIHALFMRPNVFHYHGVGPALLSWLPRIFAPRSKVVVTFHCIDRYHQKWGMIAKLALRLGEWAACKFPHTTIAVSETIQNYCLNEFQTAAACIANGVKTPTVYYNDAPLSEWDLQPEKYVLMVSRLVQHKGAHRLIEAWQLARAENRKLLGDYKLVIAGDSVFTDKYVQKLRQATHGDKSIYFTGWQQGDNLASLYAHAALLVHPSENEGLPMAVLQAMSYGKPVLVSDIPEHKEIIGDERFWFSTNDIVSLAEQLTKLVSDKKLRASNGAKNLELVKKHYSWTTLANDVVAVYLPDKTPTMRKLKMA